MKPQLLYVFIKDINRCLNNQEFCFTNDFEIRFDLTDRLLYINKKENYYRNLWGKRISNINLVIGQNGAGKTTLFDLIASTRDRRHSLFDNGTKLSKSGNNVFPEWFAVYHIKDDIFVVEGLNKDLISNIEGIPEGTSYEYSIVIEYNYKYQIALYVSYIQSFSFENKKGYSLNEKMIILYGTNIKEKKWCRRQPIWNKNDYYVGFARKYLDNPLVTNLYRFMSKEYKSIERTFTAQSIVCNIVISDSIVNLESSGKHEISEAFDLKLYNDMAPVLYFKSTNLKLGIHGFENEMVNRAKWTEKQEYIIKFYEFYIIKNWIDTIKANQEINSKQIDEEGKCIEAVSKVKFKVDDYVSRIEYLQSIVKIICDTAVNIFLPGESNCYAESIIKYAIALDKIDEKYFLSSKIVFIKMKDGFDENVNKLLETYNSYLSDDEDLKNDLYNYVSINFDNLSSGELEFINGFANLYTALDIEKLNSRFEVALIFLDEPDESFHPEWSRKYIYYLTKFLNSIEMGREFKYQIVISTHSPFMISDVPKEHITCLKVTNKKMEQ